MSDDIEVGDRVSWSSPGGKSVGRVKEKRTRPLEIKGHHVAASPENPELLVRSEKGGEAAHKPGSVHKLSESSKSRSAAKSTAAKASAKKRSSSKATSSKAAAKKSATKKSPAGKSAAKKSSAKK